MVSGCTVWLFMRLALGVLSHEGSFGRDCLAIYRVVGRVECVWGVADLSAASELWKTW